MTILTEIGFISIYFASEIVILIPFINCGLIFVINLFKLIYDINYKKGLHDIYIKEHYPEIWNKLHPIGEFFHNSFTSLSFVSGNYDDGKDEILNNIKNNLSWHSKLLIWGFFLILFNLFSIIIYIIILK